jgi:hypothetical protein
MLKQVAILLFVGISSSKHLDTINFMDEWNKVMKGFVPDDQVSF